MMADQPMEMQQSRRRQYGQLTLEICVVTFGKEGGERLVKMNLPRLPRVSYLVSWQERGEEPVPESIASREDVKVLDQQGYGSSRNRNNCLDHATGDVLLFADDDLQLYPAGLQRVLEIFEENPELEYGSFCFESDVAKSYPSRECSLVHLPKNFYQTTFEIALRRDSRAGKLRFSEQHGFAVNDFTAGEDCLLLQRARVQGLNCRFFPVKIAYHPGPTSGVRPRLSRGVILMQGAFTLLEFPATTLPRLLLGGWRIARKRRAPLMRAWGLLFLGAWKELVSRKGWRYLHAPL